MKRERLARLQAAVEAQRQAFNAAAVGQRFEVSCSSGVAAIRARLTGKSPYLQQVQADASPDLIGRVVPVEIVAAGANSLFACVIAAPARATIAA